MQPPATARTSSAASAAPPWLSSWPSSCPYYASRPPVVSPRAPSHLRCLPRRRARTVSRDGRPGGIVVPTVTSESRLGGRPPIMTRESESGLPIEPVYGPEALAGWDPAEKLGEPGAYPVHPGCLPVDVHRPALDDAPVRRFRHGGRVQRPLPAADRPRHDGPVRRLRPAHPDGPRLRRPDRARRGRQGRGRDRLDRRHAGAVRRDPAGQGLHVDDDQRPGRAAAAALPTRRRGAGRAGRPAHRHDPERRAQGVHRARHVHLPAEAVACG